MSTAKMLWASPGQWERPRAEQQNVLQGVPHGVAKGSKETAEPQAVEDQGQARRLAGAMGKGLLPQKQENALGQSQPPPALTGTRVSLLNGSPLLHPNPAPNLFSPGSQKDLFEI